MAVAWLSWLFSARRARAHSGPSALVPSTLDCADPYEDFPFQIVGESHYQDALLAIVEASDAPGPEWPDRGAECRVIADIIPMDDNPYDPLAVRVEIHRCLVGYLSRGDARRYRLLLAKNAIPVPALIVGGWDRTARGETGEKAKDHF